MENKDGVWWDGIFYYKDLTNTVKLSHQQMNHNFEMVASLSQNMTNQVDMSAQSAAEALASQQAAALSETAASQSASAANTARTQAQAANTASQTAKNEVDTKAQQVSSDATKVAQDRQAVAGHAQQVSAHAQQVATDKAQVASDKQASEAARNAATQKAGEANQSALDAKRWADESKESASAVTSVQGKNGTVNLERTDFPWMGSAAEATLNENNEVTTAGQVMRNGNHGLGGFGINVQGKDFSSPVSGFYYWGGSKPTGVDVSLPDYVSVLAVKNTTANAGRIFIDTNNSDFYFQGMGSSTWKAPVKGWHSKNLPQVSQAEINAGTQSAPRLFSPKQMSDAYVSKQFKRLVITESGEIPRPTDGPMVIVLYGAGSNGQRRSSGLAGGAGSRIVLHISSAGLFVPPLFSVEIGASGATGGATKALGFSAGNGRLYTESSSGGVAIPPSVSLLFFTAFDGESGPRESSNQRTKNSEIYGLASPDEVGFGGPGGISGGNEGGPGLVEIYY